jgi:hypothetical protein
MDEDPITKQLRDIAAEAEALGPYLEGVLLGGKRAKYTKKDGSVSSYATAQVVQYRTGPGKRRSKRVPAGRIGCVKRLLEAGRKRRALLDRHLELSAVLALDFKKKD